MNRVVKPCWVASECIVLCNAAIGGPSSTGCTDLVSLEVVDVTNSSISSYLKEPTVRDGGSMPSTCLGPLERPGIKLAVGI